MAAFMKKTWRALGFQGKNKDASLSIFEITGENPSSKPPKTMSIKNRTRGIFARRKKTGLFHDKQKRSSNSPVAVHQNVSNNQSTGLNIPSPEFFSFSESVTQELSNIESADLGVRSQGYFCSPEHGNWDVSSTQSDILDVHLPEHANWDVLSTQSDTLELHLPESFYSPEHANWDVLGSRSADLDAPAPEITIDDSVPESPKHPESQRDVSTVENGAMRDTSNSTLVASVGQGSNSASPIFVENRVGGGIDLESNTSSKGEVRYIGLQVTRQRANSLPHDLPHLSSNKGLEEPKFSQTSETNLDAEELDHDDDSDRVSIKSANRRTWDLILESQQQSHEFDMGVLKEDHQEEITTLRSEHEEEVQGLISKHQDETKAANSRKLMLQKRVKQLMQEKVTLGADLESKVATMHQAISAAQESQAICDEKERNYNYLVSSKLHEDNEKYATINKLRQENERLAGVISSMQLEQARETRAKSALAEKRQELEAKLEKASEEHRTLAAGLAKNQILASQLRDRNKQLNSALDATPNEVANISGVIELKDQMLSDAKERASESYAALTELRKTSDQDKKLATREIAALKDKLELSEISNAALQKSKSDFKRSAEEVLDMLLKKVFQTELITAMEFHFKVAIQDNEELTSLAILQHDKLSDLDDKLVSLETEIRELEKASAAKEIYVAELENQALLDSLELDKLRLEVEALPLEMRGSMGRKVARIRSLREEVERLQEGLQEAYNERQEILKAGLDERGIVYAHLQSQECERLSSANRKLEEDLSWSEEVGGQNAAHILLIESEKAKAEALIKNLQGQINGQLGLPATAGVAELVLLCRDLPERAAEEPRAREDEPESDDEMF